MKLSVIIPVYNVEKYLEACIDSCLLQDIPVVDYELILVDDGSDDDSLNMCHRYAAIHANVCVYSQFNAGQASARNLGLKYATGKYIWFVDADDTIKTNSLKTIYEQCENDELDILGVAMADVDNEGISRRLVRNEIANKIMPGRDYLLLDFSSCVTSYIFRHAFLKKFDVSFLEGVFHEDEDFSLKSLYLCPRIGFLNEVIYFVTIRLGSTTRNTNPKKAYDLITVAGSLVKFLEQKVDLRYKPVFYNRIALLINSALMNASQMNPEQAMHFKKVLHENRYLFIYLQKSSKLKYVLEGWLFLLFPAKILKIYKLLKIIQSEKSNNRQ